MAKPVLSRPRLLMDKSVLLVLSDVAQPDLVAVFDPPSPRAMAHDGLILRSGSGPSVSTRLTAEGYTEQRVRRSLAACIQVAKDAQRMLASPVRARLGWPMATGTLEVDDWLTECAAAGPTTWLLDLAGGLSPAALLRCCLLARPGAAIDLWLPVGTYPPPRTQQAQPAPAPVGAGSARGLILLRKSAKPVQQTGQQP